MEFHEEIQTVVVAQLVRASDCGSEGRGFESHLPPNTNKKVLPLGKAFFICIGTRWRWGHASLRWLGTRFASLAGDTLRWGEFIIK